MWGPVVLKLFLTEDHPIVRQGIRALLERQAGFRIVGESSDGLQTIEDVERLRPDIVVLDLMVEGISGLEVIGALRRRTPGTRVVVLSMQNADAYVVESLRRGALGYVLKGAQIADLVGAIREAAAGRTFLSPPLSDRAAEFQALARDRSAGDAYETLTPRELEVLHLAARGASSGEIGARLFISRRTVEGHRARLMAKLALRSQTDLVRYSIQRGILPASG
jgi:DNA-binding NarL/FixJ family response regulator